MCRKIISRKKAYHGVTAASASMTGLHFNHMSWDLPFKWVDHLSTPHFSREGKDGEKRTEEADEDENPFSVLAELKLGGSRKEDQ